MLLTDGTVPWEIRAVGKTTLISMVGARGDRWSQERLTAKTPEIARRRDVGMERLIAISMVAQIARIAWKQIATHL